VSLKTWVQVVLVGVLAMGTLAFARGDKHVALLVDGSTASVSSRADTVGQLLAERGVQLGVRDQVAPAVDAPLMDGEQVTVRHARLVHARLDGRPVQVWTTALTVGEAVEALGVHVYGAAVSLPPTAPVPTDGIRLEVQLPDRITIKHDYRRTVLTTTARTVGQALEQAGVDLGQRDLLDEQRDAPLVDGTVITVTRVGVDKVRVQYAVRHPVIRRDDPSMYTGEQRVVRPGRDGQGVALYRVVRHDGVVVRRTLLERTVVRAPRAEIVRVGTKARPSPTASADGLNWAALAQCESGGNPRAVNPAGYYGLYQFSLGTWASVGGSGNPIDATPDEQTYRAQLLFQRSGASPWPVCGPLLFS
jgi:resuscitation-promoting factor RpfB